MKGAISLVVQGTSFLVIIVDKVGTNIRLNLVQNNEIENTELYVVTRKKHFFFIFFFLNQQTSGYFMS